MGKKGAKGQKLSAAEISKLKVMLLTKRNEILGTVSEMESVALRRERTDLSNMPIHMADAGSDNYEIENTLGLMDSERRILVQIDDALRRIDSGKYGICEDAGEYPRRDSKQSPGPGTVSIVPRFRKKACAQMVAEPAT